MAISSTNFYSTQYLAGSQQLNKTQTKISETIKKLSTGLRLTASSEDPSSKIIANRFEARLRGVRVAVGNTEDAISAARVVNAAISDANELLMRARDLALKVMNGAVTTSQQASDIQKEFSSLRTEVFRKAFSASFNHKNILSIALTSGAFVQIGPDNNSKNAISLYIPAAMAFSLAGAYATLSIVYMSGDVLNSAAGHAASALGAISGALRVSNNILATLGVMERKLTGIVNTLLSEETTTAETAGRISGADMAAEISNFTKFQIISQSAAALLAQTSAMQIRAAEQILTGLSKA